MNDQERNELLERLERISEADPDVRLGKLIANLA